MKKYLSYYKIQCFVRVAMSKNNSAAVKIYIVFFIAFPSIFQEKYMQHRGKTTESSSIEQNHIKIQVGSALFDKKLGFGWKFGVPLGSQGVRGASQNCFIFPLIFACAEKPAWNVPREGPEPSQTAPWHLPDFIFRRFWMNLSGAFSLAHVGKRIDFFWGVSAVFCYVPEPFP